MVPSEELGGRGSVRGDDRRSSGHPQPGGLEGILEADAAKVTGPDLAGRVALDDVCGHDSGYQIGLGILTLQDEVGKLRVGRDLDVGELPGCPRAVVVLDPVPAER